MDGTFAGTPPALALGLRWLGSPFCGRDFFSKGFLGTGPKKTRLPTYVSNDTNNGE